MTADTNRCQAGAPKIADSIWQYANMLFESERHKVSVPPITQFDRTFSLDDAYAVQMENVNRITAGGHTVSGKKIGLTSAGIQKQLGVDEPDYGHLFDAMDCKDGIVQTAELIQPKIEAELAFILSKDLSGGGVTAEDVRRATAYVVGAFEIVDSRIADWKINLPDTVADNASSGRYILGEKRMKLSEIDPAGITMKLYKNGALVGEGSGAAVLSDPCVAVAWLANRLFSYGISLKKGEVILSGAFSAAPEAKKGDVFRVDFSKLGCITARFV
ncbi:MAG: fumarylacetoacetate hydrolase family protein [Clostridiales bacterium]|jgi:2-keto-4-pentenoate hydratase|nr:fumarylacetoacetate hydrolase family protein [Clostridiales bacterium]